MLRKFQGHEESVLIVLSNTVEYERRPGHQGRWLQGDLPAELARTLKDYTR